MLLIAISPILAEVEGGVSVDELVNKDKFKEFEKVNKKVVENFIASRGQSNKVGKQEILHYNKKAVGRIYHLKPSGYVVATLNKNEVPIKAYSFSGSFDNLPDGYKEAIVSRLYHYSVFIDKVEKAKITIETEGKKIWEYLESYTESSPKPIIESNIINISSSERPPEMPKDKRYFAPNQNNNILVDTRWSQSAPFNLQTKLDYNGTEFVHSPTGCTNTAWAQIMKFHEWPEDSVGTTESYLWKTETLSRNLDNTPPYDWENMTNTGSSEVAPLMADIGYAMKSDWHYYGTGAIGFDSYARGAIAKHFGYSTNMYTVEYNDFTSSSQYENYRNTVRSDINNLRPLHTSYFHTTQPLGHAVVADGYRNVSAGGDSFEVHYNTGWGEEIGANDGNWFIITPNASGVFAQDFDGMSIFGVPDSGSISSITTVAGIQPCSGSDCHATFSYLSYVGNVNNGGHKDGITLVNGWNLVAMMSSGTKVNYTNFVNADDVWEYNNTIDDWVDREILDSNNNPIPLAHRHALFVHHSGTTEYIFPGLQTEAVELTANYLDSLPSGKYLYLGTGKDISLSFLNAHDINYCRVFINPYPNPTYWADCPSTIEAGTGFLVFKQ